MELLICKLLMRMGFEGLGARYLMERWKHEG